MPALNEATCRQCIDDFNNGTWQNVMSFTVFFFQLLILWCVFDVFSRFHDVKHFELSCCWNVIDGLIDWLQEGHLNIVRSSDNRSTYTPYRLYLLKLWSTRLFCFFKLLLMASFIKATLSKLYVKFSWQANENTACRGVLSAVRWFLLFSLVTWARIELPTVLAGRQMVRLLSSYFPSLPPPQIFIEVSLISHAVSPSYSIHFTTIFGVSSRSPAIKYLLQQETEKKT